jgi:hypothetical protein
MKKQVSQKSKIEAILRKGRLLTPTQAKSYGITKPSARITELRNEGMFIIGTTNKSGNFAWKLATPAFA